MDLARFEGGNVCREVQANQESGRPLLLTPEDEVVSVKVEAGTRIVDVVPGDRLVDEIAAHGRSAEAGAEPLNWDLGDLTELTILVVLVTRFLFRCVSR